MNPSDSTIRVLLTGAAGFAGSHCLVHLLKSTKWLIICPVSFKHSGLPERLVYAVGQSNHNADHWARVQIIKCDLSSPISSTTANLFGHIDSIINYAAESHVERSIQEPVSFIQNNVDLILSILEFARKVKPSIVIQISTDEVTGGAAPGSKYIESSPIVPSSPYSASKAAQEAIAVCYWRTYRVPLVIVNCVSLIGEIQDPENFVPKIILRIAHGEDVHIQVAENGTMCSRSYVHAGTLADAVLFLVKRGNVTMCESGVDAVVMPDRYSTPVDQTITDFEMAKKIAGILGKPLTYQFVDAQVTQPGHNLRYDLNGTRLGALGWKPYTDFHDILEQLVQRTVKEQRLWQGQNGIGNDAENRVSKRVGNVLLNSSQKPMTNGFSNGFDEHHINV